MADRFADLDGDYYPFTDYPNYSAMAPCMRDCEELMGYNGCDRAACWCKKGNLDLRVQDITRCASTECDFVNMNTQTDVDIISAIQVEYCLDHSVSPSGMTLPSTAEAVPTSDSLSSGPATLTDAGPATGTAADSRTRVTSGPAANTGGAFLTSTSPQVSIPSSTTTSESSSSSSSSSSLSTTAKIGIGIGGAFCVLLAILIIVLIRRRRSRQQYPPLPQNSFQNGPPPNIAPPPFLNTTPSSPAPQPQVAQIISPDRPVSPLEEKTAPTVTVTRKQVNDQKLDISPQSTPAPKYSQPHMAEGPREVHGDVPTLRHEFGSDGEITNTVTIRGTEMDAQQQPRFYQGQQAYPYHAQEAPQELYGRGQGQGGAYMGQQYGVAYELGSGR